MKIAKNYLSEIELQRKLLTGNGKISHKQAIKKAEKKFEIYREKEMKQMESDFDGIACQLGQKETGQSLI